MCVSPPHRAVPAARFELHLPPHHEAEAAAPDEDVRGVCENATLFLEGFPYVCPEPVLAKMIVLYINGSKSGVCRTDTLLRLHLHDETCNVKTAI